MRKNGRTKVSLLAPGNIDKDNEMVVTTMNNLRRSIRRTHKKAKRIESCSRHDHYNKPQNVRAELIATSHSFVFYDPTDRRFAVAV